jgi:hypothetical protein
MIIAPMRMAINPESFSAIVNPTPTSSLMSYPLF